MKLQTTLRFAAILAAIAIGFTGAARAADWSGANAVWSSTANPGWGGTPPNAVGAVANNSILATATTFQDITPNVTVGTISLTGSGNFSWTHTLTNPLTLNQDGGGSGFATISNANLSTGTTNALIIGASATDTITLADDLLISNTGGSKHIVGSIQMNSIITGSGNVTFYNEVTSIPGAPANEFPGVIRLTSNTANTFTGNVLIKKGITHISNNTSLGNAANVVTIGDSSGGGQGSASLLVQAGAVVFGNPIVVSSGTGGDLFLGGTTTSTPTISGNILLSNAATNLNVVSNSTSTNGTLFSGVISGAGSITMPALQLTGAANTRVRFTAANTYAGDTVISGGTLVAEGGSAIPDGTGKGNVSLTANGTFLQIGANEVINGLSGVVGSTVRSNTTTTRTLTVGGGNANSTFSGIFAINGAGLLNVTKTGTGITTFSGSAVSTTTGILRPDYNGGTLRLDFANRATPTNLMDPGMSLRATGGTLEILGKSTGSTSQTFASLNLNFSATSSVGHDATILLSPNGGAGTSITINTINRNIGSQVNFAVTGGTSGTFNSTTANLNGSILGGYAIFQGNTWAVASGSTISGLADGLYVTTTTNGNSAANYTASHNIDVNTSPNLDAPITVNSLRFKANAANTLTLNGAGTSIVNSGGILVTSAVGNNPTVIAGGTLAGNGSGSGATPSSVNGTVTSAADLIVHQLNTSNVLEISSVIADGTSGVTALSKSGAGTLKLSNVTDNTYSGSTFIANGTLMVNAPNAIPHGSGKGYVAVNGTLDVNGNSISVNGLEVRPSGKITSGVAGNVTLTMGENNDATEFTAGSTVQNGSGVLAVDKIGSGTFISSTQATYSGGTRISSGTLSIRANSTPTSGVVTSGPIGTGLLTLGNGTTVATNGDFTIGNSVKTDGTTTFDLATNSLTVNGALTSTAPTDVINMGATNGTVLFNGDISGYFGTFNVNSSAGNSLNLSGQTAASQDGSNAKFVLSGPTPGAGRILRFSNDNNDTVKLGSLSGAGLINPNSNLVAPNFMVEVGNLNMEDIFSGSIISGATTTMSYRKVGTGSLTFSGTNAYRGTTTVSSGTLIAGADAVSTTVSGVTIPASAVDVTNNELTLAGHGMVNGDRVTFTGTRPGGTASQTFYYVVNSTANTFKVSTTAGGTALDITSATTATFSQAGAFGASNTAIVLGDAGTGSNNVSLLTEASPQVTIERAINVTSNGSGTATIGGKIDANSTFSGPITLSKNVSLTSVATGANTVNVSGVISSTGAFGVTKKDAGNVTLSAANTYSGGTAVDSGLLTASGASATFGTGSVTVTGGILEIATGVTNAIANTAALSLAGGGSPSFADIGYAILGSGINEQVNALILNGITKPLGTYGSTASGAMFPDDEFFSGSGIITVALPTLPGDFNNDTHVNAADYVIWRKTMPGDMAKYLEWRTNFDNPPGSGSGLGGSAAVPEPASLGLVFSLAVAALGCRRSRLRRVNS